MNKNFLLSSLALFVAGASFAGTNEITQLPAYTVTVDRHTDAEKAIEASLAEFRRSAAAARAVPIQPALPASAVAKRESAIPAPVAASSRTLRVAVKA